MKIAIDKSSLGAIKKGNTYYYLYDDEKLDDLVDLGLHCIYYKNCEYVDINLTDYDIDCRKKAKITDVDYDVLPPKTNYKIGIIVPNYNYEHTIEKCLMSILNQTYTNYEIIYVDDVSTDDSVKIVERIKEENKDKIIKIVKLKQKRLNGGARNEGYLYLSDDVDYVYYIDSDDWLYNEDVLDKINEKLQGKPDVLFVGLMEWKNNKYNVNYLPNYVDKYEAFNGWSGSCGKVVKKQLATRQECLYNEGTLKEDKNQHCKICYYMKSFALLKEPVYVWNKENYKSVTTLRDDIKWKVSTIRHYADTMELAERIRGGDRKIDEMMNKRLILTREEMLSGRDYQW